MITRRFIEYFRLSLIAASLFRIAASNVDSREPTQAPLVLYDFREMTGSTVHDRSGNQPPLDLRISNDKRVRWHRDALEVFSSVSIKSLDPATRLTRSIKATGEVTVDIWLTPANLKQKGPARVLTLSASTDRRNLSIGQVESQYDIRLRSDRTNENGMPSVSAPLQSAHSRMQHLVYIHRADGGSEIYLDGHRLVEASTEGSLDVWDENYHLVLANEFTGDRPWMGRLHRVAIYDRAWSEAEVHSSYQQGTGVWTEVAARLPDPVGERIDFASQVKPIFEDHCYECHAGESSESGFHLGRRSRALEGGFHGPAMIPGDSLRSALIHWVAGIDHHQLMPPKEHGTRLSDRQIGILRGWIDQGCVWPAEFEIPDSKIAVGKEHWAFQPLSGEVTGPMTIEQEETSIDAFVLAKCSEKNLSRSTPAQPSIWLRRAYMDAIGLPPSPEEVDSFVEAFQRDETTARKEVIDRLLSSDRFGERWARHWLDLARYADSDGQEGDIDRPEAYRYRDFVIRAFNRDMPLDQFLKWQIAGDQYEPDHVESLAATGFLTAGPHTVLDDKFLDEERFQNRYNELDDMLSTVGGTFLGLTIGCARCHDHKYDAISSRDYYRLLSAFHSGDRQIVELSAGKVLTYRDASAAPATTWLFPRGDFFDRRQEVQFGFPEVLMNDRTAMDYWERSKSERTSASEPQVSEPQVSEAQVSEAQVSEAQVSEAQVSEEMASSTFQRRALAEWMTDVQQGAGALVARVYVNRIWQHYFGEGIVRTPSDFGVQGEPPTHPELLEWMAQDLVSHGWQSKRLHRMILTSRTYQQSSQWKEEQSRIDPENRWLWRMPMKRLEVEVVRDSMLAAAQSLDLSMYGPAFRPPIAEEAMVARNLKSPYTSQEIPALDTRRRSVYMYHKRVVPYPLFQAFDKPDSLQSCARRDQTIVATQALAILNDSVVREYAAEMASSIVDPIPPSPSYLQSNGSLPNERSEVERWVIEAFRRALGRRPSETEKMASVDFVMNRCRIRQDRSEVDSIRTSMTDFCQSLFGLNEFLFVD